MARRSVLLMVAVIIALIGTALIVMYVQGIENRATQGQELVEVLVATDTIDVGEPVSAAQEAAKFEKKTVRREDLVPGAIDSTGTISDLVATGTIYPGEQLIAKNFGRLGDAQNLAIPAGMIAVSVELTDPARVAGFVNPGSDVAVFVSADPVRILPDGKEQKLATYTRLLLPKVQVLGVGTTSTTSRTTKEESGTATTEEIPKTILTVAVSQKDAEKLIYAARNGSVSFALLTDKSSVKDAPGVRLIDIMPEALQ